MTKNPTNIPINVIGNIARARTHNVATATIRKANESTTATSPCAIDRRLPLPAMTAIRSGKKPIAPMSIPITKANGSSKLIVGNASPFRPWHVGFLQYIAHRWVCPQQKDERMPIMNIRP